MDVLWTPPAGGPLVTHATARERAALLRRTPSRQGRAARRESAQPAQQFHQAGRPGRPVRPSPAVAGVPAVAQDASAPAPASGSREVLRLGGVARDAGDGAGGGAQRRPGPLRRPKEERPCVRRRKRGGSAGEERRCHSPAGVDDAGRRERKS